MEDKSVRLLDSYFDFIYARKISNIVYTVAKEHCVGCQHVSLSQSDHTCLLEKKALLDLHFDHILKLIDEDSIIQIWYTSVLCSDISPELIEMYKLKIKCRDWRDTDMKTPFWRRKMINMATDIINLERNFVWNKPIPFNSAEV